MVIQVVKYKCETCNEEYSTNEFALDCESKGTETPLVEIGDMIQFEVVVNGGFNNIFLDLRIKNIEKVKHFIFYSLEAEPEKGVWVDSLYDIFGNSQFRKRVRGFSL